MSASVYWRGFVLGSLLFGWLPLMYLWAEIPCEPCSTERYETDITERSKKDTKNSKSSASVPHHSGGQPPSHQSLPPAQADPAPSALQSYARQCLKSKFYTPGVRQDKKVFSQMGEDGIIAAAFECINTTSKYYVEFGVQNGQECTTRLLREKHGWTGLLMDGSNDNPAINLHAEMLTSVNIASLFQKYKVPQRFDHMTVDIDMNTFWVLQAVLAAGYRPRFMSVEINRNFPSQHQAYAALNLPTEMWEIKDLYPGARGWGIGGSCYFGASPLAVTRLAQFFGYRPIVFDEIAINLFFVHVDVVGIVPPPAGDGGAEQRPDELDADFKLAAAAAALPQDVRALGWPIHDPCPYHVWAEVVPGIDFGAPDWEAQLRPVVLAGKCPHKSSRTFYEAHVLGVEKMGAIKNAPQTPPAL